MHRFVVILMILSLSGSGASSGSEPIWSIFGGRNQNREPLRFDDSALHRLEALLEIKKASINPKEMPNDFELARELAEEFDEVYELERSEKIETDGMWRVMNRIVKGFRQLKSIDESIKTKTIDCGEPGISKLLEMEESLERGLSERMDGIEVDIGSFFFKRASEISEEFFTHCMEEKRSQFYLIGDDQELKDAFEQMGVFDIFIDAEEVAQRPELPRYCNRENQIIDLKTYWSLVQKIGAQAGKEPAIWEGNVGLYELEERKEMMSEFFSRTCGHEKFGPVVKAVDFIMLAKTSKLNRDWNQMFDCGEKMGRFQLCRKAWEILAKF